MNSYENDIDPRAIDPDLNLSGWKYSFIFAGYKERSKSLGPRLRYVVVSDFLQYFVLVHTAIAFFTVRTAV